MWESPTPNIIEPKNIKIRHLTQKEHKIVGVMWHNDKCLEEQDTTLIYIYEVPPKTS